MVKAHSPLMWDAKFRKLEVIFQTRGKVFHQDIQTPRGGLKKQGAAEFFASKHQEVAWKNKVQPSFFAYLMKHSFECFK